MIDGGEAFHPWMRGPQDMLLVGALDAGVGVALLLAVSELAGALLADLGVALLAGSLGGRTTAGAPLAHD